MKKRHVFTQFTFVIALMIISRISWKPAPDAGDTRSYRDLNKNGRMDIYEDPGQSAEKRIDDLLNQMTLEEKAGTMFITFTIVNIDGSIEVKPSPGLVSFSAATEMITAKKMHHFNLSMIPKVDNMARWYNSLQKFAEGTRLGIPVTIASDPRHAVNMSRTARNTPGQFSSWCDMLGFAAIGDRNVIRQYADIVRQEYLALGIREALHPVADLSTEPRWALISNTFGEDANMAASLTEAYITAMQQEKLNANGIACMTKHFPGAGPQKDGMDSHFETQKYQVYPGNRLSYHLIPFEAAVKAKTSAIMVYYGIADRQTTEQVGSSYNTGIVSGLLRKKIGYDGIVCTDWGVVSDSKIGNNTFKARAWGVETLSIADRIKKLIDAGCDMIGGESCPEVIVDLVNKRQLSEKRIDSSVRRILQQKFQLGLFDNPFIDTAKASEIVGNSSFRESGMQAQRMAMTLLKNEDRILPLKSPGIKVFLVNVDSSAASRYATVVTDLNQADVALIRLNTPYYQTNPDPIARIFRFHEGDLDFKGRDLELILGLLKSKTTIADIYLDRPAVIPEISSASKALLANFGASDEAFLDIVFGRYSPRGKLPFELPSSMAAVYAQKEDVPHDSGNPLFKFNFGLSY